MGGDGGDGGDGGAGAGDGGGDVYLGSNFDLPNYTPDYSPNSSWGDAEQDDWRKRTAGRGLSGMWSPVYGELGQQMPSSNLDNGSGQFQQVNYGDLGSLGNKDAKPGDWDYGNNSFLAKLGWTGASPYVNSGSGATGTDAERGNTAPDHYSSEFHNFLNNKGITFGQNEVGGKYALQGFGPDGRALGGQYLMKPGNDDAFGIAALAAGGFAGAAAAGAGAAGAGAASGAGEGGAAVSGMDLAADAGYAGANGVGGASASFSTPSLLDTMGQGALKGGATNAGKTAWDGGDLGDIAKAGVTGAVTGAVGAGISAYNPAGEMGVTNPIYQRAINSGISGGVNAGMTGGNIGTGALMSGAISGGSSAIGAGARSMWDNYGPGEGGGMTSGAGDESWKQGGGMYSTAPLGSDWNGSLMDNRDQTPMLSGAAWDPNSSGFQGYATDAAQAGAAQKPRQQDNPIKALAMQGLNRFTGGSQGSPNRFDNMGANLFDMYNKYKGYKAAGQLRGQLNDMFSPNSAYAQQMNERLSRADAATGRRSQIGARQVELQARLAEMNSRNAPMINQLDQRRDGLRNGMLSDVYRGMSGGKNGGGGYDLLRSGVSGLQSMYDNYNFGSGGSYGSNDLGSNYADGGPVRREPVVGSRSPVRTGGGGGLSADAIRAVATPASSPQNQYVDPINPRSVNDYRERMQMAQGGSVRGPGGPRSDSIPANLSNGEHVFDARSVNALGGGSNERGQARLNELRARLHRS